MLISKVIGEKNILVPARSSEKGALFEEMVHALEDLDDEIDADEVLQTLWKREDMLNTRVAPGIAIPHTQVRHLERTTGMLAVSQQGVNYGLSDGEKIHIILMIVDDEHDTVEHLDTLRNFALIAKNQRFVDQLKASRTPAEVVELIRRYETMLK